MFSRSRPNLTPKGWIVSLSFFMVAFAVCMWAFYGTSFPKLASFALYCFAGVLFNRHVLLRFDSLTRQGQKRYIAKQVDKVRKLTS